MVRAHLEYYINPVVDSLISIASCSHTTTTVTLHQLKLLKGKVVVIVYSEYIHAQQVMSPGYAHLMQRPSGEAEVKGSSNLALLSAV